MTCPSGCEPSTKCGGCSSTPSVNPPLNYRDYKDEHDKLWNRYLESTAAWRAAWVRHRITKDEYMEKVKPLLDQYAKDAMRLVRRVNKWGE